MWLVAAILDRRQQLLSPRMVVSVPRRTCHRDTRELLKSHGGEKECLVADPWGTLVCPQWRL